MKYTLVLGLFTGCFGQMPCVPTQTCGDPGAPVHGCASPTPILAWDDVDPWKVDGQDVYWKDSNTSGWTLFWDIPCSTWFDDDSMVWFKFCHGMSARAPVQRITDLEKISKDFMIRNYVNTAQGKIESVDSATVTICMPPIWRGGPYQ